MSSAPEPNRPAPAATASRARSRGFVFVARVVIMLLLTVPVLRWTGIVESLTFYHPEATQPKAPPGVEEVSFTAADGKLVHGWFMPATQAAPGTRSPVVLYCHGNMGDVSFFDQTLDHLPDAGIGVLLFDYRGFGRTPRDLILKRENLLLDAEAALNYLRSRPDVDPKRIGVFGYSLGGTFAMQLAADHADVRSVIAVATFASWPSIASDVIPVAGHVLIRTGLGVEDNIQRMGTRPVLIIHGDNDSIVGYHHLPRIQKAAESAGVKIEAMTIAGAGHLNIFKPDVKAAIRAFYERTLASE